LLLQFKNLMGRRAARSCPAGWAAAFALGLALISPSLSAAAGEGNLLIVNDADFIDRDSGALLTFQSFVWIMADKLMSGSQWPYFPFTIQIVAGDAVNARAECKKGSAASLIRVEAGLLSFVGNVDELAAVVGHELGHCWIARNAPLAKVRGKKARELLADQLGMRAMAKAGFDPRRAVALLERRDGRREGAAAASDEHPAWPARRNEMNLVLARMAAEKAFDPLRAPTALPYTPRDLRAVSPFREVLESLALEDYGDLPAALRSIFSQLDPWAREVQPASGKVRAVALDSAFRRLMEVLIRALPRMAEATRTELAAALPANPRGALFCLRPETLRDWQALARKASVGPLFARQGGGRRPSS
jgi:hypothetical protein